MFHVMRSWYTVRTNPMISFRTNPMIYFCYTGHDRIMHGPESWGHPSQTSSQEVSGLRTQDLSPQSTLTPPQKKIVGVVEGTTEDKRWPLLLLFFLFTLHFLNKFMKKWLSVTIDMRDGSDDQTSFNRWYSRHPRLVRSAQQNGVPGHYYEENGR